MYTCQWCGKPMHNTPGRQGMPNYACVAANCPGLFQHQRCATCSGTPCRVVISEAGTFDFICTRNHHWS